MSRKQKIYDDDDGRSFADMNVDGMPWTLRKRTRDQSGSGGLEDLSAEDKRHIMTGVFIAVIAATLIFGAIFLFAILLMNGFKFK